MTPLEHLNHLLGQAEPLTTHEDRTRLWFWVGMTVAAILIGLAFCGPSIVRSNHQSERGKGETDVYRVQN